MPTVEALRAALTAATGVPDPTVRLLLGAGDAGARLDHLRREADAASLGLPPALGATRRTHLLAWDSTTVTWEGWDTVLGHRLVIRALRPEARGRADAWARLALAAQEPGAVAFPPPDPWPRVEIDAFSMNLADLLPLEEPSEPGWRLGVLGAALVGLERAGRSGGHGAVCADMVVWNAGRWRLVWPGPADERPGTDARLRGIGGDALAPGPGLAERADLATLGWLAASLGEPLLAGFAETPPPSVALGAELVRRELASALARARHELVRRRRVATKAAGAADVLRLAERLWRRVPPPPATGCLRAGRDAVLHLVMCDGKEIVGGASAGGGLHLLPPVLRHGRLDPAAARALLRAWSGRDTGDEPRRAEIQARLRADDDALERLVRWLRAALRLRTDLLLLGGSLPRAERGGG